MSIHTHTHALTLHLCMCVWVYTNINATRPGLSNDYYICLTRLSKSLSPSTHYYYFKLRAERRVYWFFNDVFSPNNKLLDSKTPQQKDSKSIS